MIPDTNCRQAPAAYCVLRDTRVSVSLHADYGTHYKEVSTKPSELEILTGILSSKILYLRCHLKYSTSLEDKMGLISVLFLFRRENKILQAANDNYLKLQKDNLKSVDPKLTLAEQRLEAMFQELVTIFL